MGSTRPRKGTGPGVARAGAYVRSIIDKSKSPGMRLPSVEDLSRFAGVSYQTMRTALRGLKADGVVDGLRGRRFSILSGPPERPEPGPPHLPYAFEQAAEAIRRDLLNARLGMHGTLPSGKELCARYRVSYPTLRKAISVLRKESVIDHTPSRVVSSGFGTRREGAIVFIILTGSPNEPLSSGVFTLDLVRHIEYSCSQAGVGLRTVLCCGIGGSHRYYQYPHRTECPLPLGDDVFGYLLLDNSSGSAGRTPPLELTRMRKPLALLDASGQRRKYEPIPADRRWCLFRVGTSRQVGYRAGRYLLDYGHRKAAYISAFPGWDWSTQRLGGLAGAFADAGLRDAIVSLAIEPILTNKELTAAGLKRCAFSPFDRRLDERISQLPLSFSSLGDKLRSEWNERITNCEAAFRVEPLLAAAQRDRDITAWVFANDWTLSFALPFLKRARLYPPRDISMLSFDDSAVSLEQGFTSYNFNLPALAEAAVGFVLRGQTGKGLYKEAILELDGVFVERGTVRKA